MTLAASSCVYDLTAALYTLLNKETSGARLYASDSSNTNAVAFKDAWRALNRSVNQLDGLAASTAELNKSDGIAGYPIAAAAAGNIMASTKRAVTGSTNMNLYNVFGITTMKAAFVQLSQSTNPGANFAFTRSSYCAASPNHKASSKTVAGTLLVKVYKPTASSVTTPIPSGSAVTLAITAWGV